jgi:hypothetical protein
LELVVSENFLGGFVGLGFSQMEVRANIFLVITCLKQIIVELSESFFNPCHEFFLHDVTVYPDARQEFIVSFDENFAIEAVIFYIREIGYRRGAIVFTCG